jgi:hypothetical protein
MNTYVIQPTPFRVIVGEPIPTAGLVSRDMEALSARVHKSMSELFYSHSKLVAPAVEVQPENTTI